MVTCCKVGPPLIIGPCPGCPGTTGPVGLHLERPFPNATAPTNALVSAGLKDGLLCRIAVGKKIYSQQFDELVNVWSSLRKVIVTDWCTCTFCISVITRIVQLLQQIGAQLIQSLDLFLLRGGGKHKGFFNPVRLPRTGNITGQTRKMVNRL